MTYRPGFGGLLRSVFGGNNSNAYRPLPTNQSRTAASNTNNVNQSSTGDPATSRRRRHGRPGSPTQLRQTPALQPIPEEQAEDDSAVEEETDDHHGESYDNSNTNNSCMLPTLNVNNSARSRRCSLDGTLWKTGDDAQWPLLLPSVARRREAVKRACTAVTVAWPVTNLDDDGFQTVDLFAA